MILSGPSQNADFGEELAQRFNTSIKNKLLNTAAADEIVVVCPVLL